MLTKLPSGQKAEPSLKNCMFHMTYIILDVHSVKLVKIEIPSVEVFVVDVLSSFEYDQSPFIQN